VGRNRAENKRRMDLACVELHLLDVVVSSLHCPSHIRPGGNPGANGWFL